MTKKHKCHVFRCDVPARAVARALLESHQKERTVKAQSRRESTGNTNTTAAALQERRKRDSTEGSSGNLTLIEKSCLVISTWVPKSVLYYVDPLVNCFSSN